MHRSHLPAALVLLLTAGILACATYADEQEAEGGSEEPELARYMADLQRWSHKSVLALEARHAELADFYLHEMEETVETVREEAPTYEGHPVGDLTESMLAPAVAALDSALAARDWPSVDRRVQELARACNECHDATDHGFVRVDFRDLPNPYAQRFDTLAGR